MAYYQPIPYQPPGLTPSQHRHRFPPATHQTVLPPTFYPPPTHQTVLPPTFYPPPAHQPVLPPTAYLPQTNPFVLPLAPANVSPVVSLPPLANAPPIITIPQPKVPFGDVNQFVPLEQNAKPSVLAINITPMELFSRDWIKAENDALGSFLVTQSKVAMFRAGFGKERIADLFQHNPNLLIIVILYDQSEEFAKFAVEFEKEVGSLRPILWVSKNRDRTQLLKMTFPINNITYRFDLPSAMTVPILNDDHRRMQFATRIAALLDVFYPNNFLGHSATTAGLIPLPRPESSSIPPPPYLANTFPHLSVLNHKVYGTTDEEEDRLHRDVDAFRKFLHRNNIGVTFHLCMTEGDVWKDIERYKKRGTCIIGLHCHGVDAIVTDNSHVLESSTKMLFSGAHPLLWLEAQIHKDDDSNTRDWPSATIVFKSETLPATNRQGYNEKVPDEQGSVNERIMAWIQKIKVTTTSQEQRVIQPFTDSDDEMEAYIAPAELNDEGGITSFNGKDYLTPLPPPTPIDPLEVFPPPPTPIDPLEVFPPPIVKTTVDVESSSSSDEDIYGSWSGNSSDDDFVDLTRYESWSSSDDEAPVEEEAAKSIFVVMTEPTDADQDRAFAGSLQLIGSQFPAFEEKIYTWRGGQEKIPFDPDAYTDIVFLLYPSIRNGPDWNWDLFNEQLQEWHAQLVARAEQGGKFGYIYVITWYPLLEKVDFDDPTVSRIKARFLYPFDVTLPFALSVDLGIKEMLLLTQEMTFLRSQTHRTQVYAVTSNDTTLRYLRDDMQPVLPCIAMRHSEDAVWGNVVIDAMKTNYGTDAIVVWFPEENDDASFKKMVTHFEFTVKNLKSNALGKLRRIFFVIVATNEATMLRHLDVDSTDPSIHVLKQHNVPILDYSIHSKEFFDTYVFHRSVWTDVATLYGKIH